MSNAENGPAVKGTRPTKFGEASFAQFQTTMAAGLKILPLHKPFATRKDVYGNVTQTGKMPRDPKWTTAHYDPDIVFGDCFPAFVNMGYRFQNGQGGFDIDARKGGVESFAKFCADHPDFNPAIYPRAKSGGDGGGFHVLFKLPSGFKVRHLIDEEKYPGLEVATKGRQFVSPGSFHPTSGRMYEWDESFPSVIVGLPNLPDSVLDKIARQSRKGKVPGCGKYTAEQMGRMLSGLDADDFSGYDDWLKIMMAAHFGTDGDAEAEFDEWSSNGVNYAGSELIAYKWGTFSTEGDSKVTHKTILKLLRDAGKGHLIPVLADDDTTIAAEDDFDDVEDDDGVDVLADLVERIKTDPAAPLKPEALKAFAKLEPHEREETYDALKRAGFKKLTTLAQEVRKATPKKATQKKASTMDLLQRIVGTEATISLQSDGTVFAEITADGIEKCINVAGTEFDEWLSYRLYKLTQQSASKAARDDAIQIIVAAAKHEGAPTYPSFVRVARFEGAIYLDLCNDQREAVKIDSKGWAVVSSTELPEGFRFVRSKGMQPLPKPADADKGDLKLLRGLFNIKPDGTTPKIDDSGFVLLVCYLLSCFTNGPYPILVMDGGAGTAKSTNCDLAKSIIDPSFAAERSMPSNELDLFVSAMSSKIQLYDNLSRIPDWFSDALCRLATGGGLSKRELYTDADEYLMRARNPVILNGLHQDMMRKNDLLDRALIVTLRRISQAENKSEEKVRADFAAALPVVLAGLLNMVAHGLGRLSSVSHEGAQTRLADFERWSNACESFLWREGTFDRAYMGMRSVAKSKLLLRSPVSRALIEFMDGKKRWTGTAADLNTALYNIHVKVDDWTVTTAPEDRWPGALHIFSRRLRDAQGMLLEAKEIVIEFKELDDRTIVISRDYGFG